MKLFRKIKGKLGFTLAEMLIVVAILAILTAVAAPNVAKYSRSINLRELNDSARAIYMAAEHKFMNEIEMGRTLPEGADVDKSALKSRYGDDASAVNVKYLKSESTDLQKLMTSGSAAGDSTGVIESQLYDNNYIVEYNPETGDVFGVFYSEDDDLSGYESESCYPSISDMQKEKLIGYYGSDNVKPEEKTNSKVLPKPEVEIINKEKLVVKITAPTRDGAAPYSINAKIGETWIIPETGYEIIPGTTVDLILDSLNGGTITMSNTLAGPYEASIDTWLGSAVTDGSDMTLTVTFYDKDGKTRDQSVTKTFNPLFANGSTDDTAYIEYGRHLQNLDKCSAITTAVIKKTINFASTADNYEGWANANVYPGRKFVSLPASSINISARSGAEIQNIDIQGVDVYEDETLYAGLFTLFSGNATNLVFRNPKAESSSIVGIFCGYGMSAVVDTVTVINPKIECDNCAGGLIGMDGLSHIINCAVYVEEDDNYSWGDPNNDPYYHYTIVAENTDNYSGGLVGLTTLTTIKESYAAVKVSCEKGKAGGLVGFCSSETFIENSFSAGHTYYGIFEGNAKDGKEINLKDNVRGNIAGGIVSESQGDNEINIIGTVFSTCSVSGTTVDLAYNGTAVIKDGATVYTLGTAYLPDGTKTTKSSDERVKTGDEVKVDDSSAAVGKRYDLKVSSVYKYPLPTTGMTMHGDWPSSDAVTGFFYWEKHGEDYNFHILCDDCHEKEYENLCKKQYGSNITAYGYGAFSVGGSLDSAVTFSDGTDDVTIDEREEDAEKTVEAVTEAIQKALAAVDDLNPTTVAVKLYNVTDVSSSGFVTATVGGNEYVFAPDFYAISAGKDTARVGTDADVFGVRCKNHLQNVANAVAGNFVQSHDINYKDDTTGGLTPIGNSTNKFTGTYDGGSYRIIDAKFNTTADSEYAGLFGVTNGAELENIVMFNEAATADEFDKNKIEGKTVGGLVAKSTDGTISNCVVSGYTITGDTASGGIVGDSTGTKIETCEANVKLSGDGNVGGIAGSADSIDNCYALVHGYDGKADETLGGIVGGASIDKVDGCYVMFKDMPKEGYPIANHTNGKNIYVVSYGFYPTNGLHTNANDTAVEFKKLAENLTGAPNAEKTYLKSAVDYAEKGDSEAYLYLAMVKDKYGKFVHYGPTAEPVKNLLVRGPLAGIYEFGKYDFGENNFNGWLSYNKYGKIYDAKYSCKDFIQKMVNDNVSAEKLFRGVFISDTISTQEKENLRVEVDIKGGSETKSYKISELQEKDFSLLDAGSYLCSGRDSDFNIVDTLADYELNNTDKSIYRFTYYIFPDLAWSQITEIRIYYEPSDKPEGMLIYADFTKEIENYSRAQLPDSIVEYEAHDLPRMGTFQIYNLKYVNGAAKNGLFMSAVFNDGSYMYCKGDGGALDGSRMGIIMEEDKYRACEDNITILVNNEYFDFTPWLEPYDAFYSNIEEYDGYILSLINSSMFDISSVRDLNIEILYGKSIVYTASENAGFYLNFNNGLDEKSVIEEHEKNCKLTRPPAVALFALFKGNSGSYVVNGYRDSLSETYNQQFSSRYNNNESIKTLAIGVEESRISELGDLLEVTIGGQSATWTECTYNFNESSAENNFKYKYYTLIPDSRVTITADTEVTVAYKNHVLMTYKAKDLDPTL